MSVPLHESPPYIHQQRGGGGLSWSVSNDFYDFCRDRTFTSWSVGKWRRFDDTCRRGVWTPSFTDVFTYSLFFEVSTILGVPVGTSNVMFTNDPSIYPCLIVLGAPLSSRTTRETVRSSLVPIPVENTRNTTPNVFPETPRTEFLVCLHIPQS